MAAERAAFRSLLRQCREADRNPLQLAAMIGHPPRQYDRRSRRNSRLFESDWMFVDDAFAKAGGGCTEFAHPAFKARAATLAAREHRRLSSMLGLDYAAQAREAAKRLQSAGELLADLGALSASPEGGAAGEAACLGLLTRLPPGKGRRELAEGDVLITHPLSCILQPVFDQALIAIDGVSGSGDTVRGVRLNRPAGTTLRELLHGWPAAGDRAWAEALGALLDAPLHLGGPVVGSSLQEGLSWFYTDGQDVEGSRQVLPGVWAGGEPGAVSELVVRQPGSVRVCFGYAGWAGAQLATELERGVWVHARPGPESAEGVARMLFGTGGAQAGWRAALLSAGMPVLAAFPRGEGVDDRLAQLVEGHYKAMQ